LCGGVWTDKIGQSKIANKAFAADVLSINGNRIGLVGYGTIANETDYHPLSDDITSLNSTIDYWPIKDLTCICCGINRAVTDLKSSGNDFKAIVLMSDGQANVNCSASATKPIDVAIPNSINAAKEAYEKYGIRVYTIGFGLDADLTTLRNISEKGGGKFYFSDVSHLSEIYNQVYQEMKENWEAEKNWDHLKVVFYNATTSYEFRIYDPPKPLETRKYTIPFSEELNKHITQITKIQIYPVVVMESGKQIIGPALDTWELEYE
jgi:hypothetical protein